MADRHTRKHRDLVLNRAEPGENAIQLARDKFERSFVSHTASPASRRTASRYSLPDPLAALRRFRV